MYCNNCGKEITENVKFCTHCGAKLEDTSNKPLSSDRNAPISKIGLSKIVGFIPIILMAILGIMFLSTAISRWQGNADAFDWTSDSAKMLGIILHWGIMGVFLGTCIECICNYVGKGMRGEILVTNSISLFVLAIVLQIGHWIFNDWDTKDMSIIMYRIFGTYTDLIGVSIFFAIVMFIVGVLLVKINNSGK